MNGFYCFRVKTAQRVAEDFMPSALWWAAGKQHHANDNQEST